MFFLTTHSTERGVANRAESWYAAATQVATRMQCFLRNIPGLPFMPWSLVCKPVDTLVMLLSIQKRTVGDRMVPPPFPRTNTPASAGHRATSDLFLGNF